jgi:nucleoside-diphosphate-sugar epimerase
MKLLLVGGTGVLSAAVTHEALKKGIEVFMINRGNKTELIPQGVHLLKADINNNKEIIDLLDGLSFDAVIDFICYTDKQLEYSFNLFKDRVNQYVYISSCAVYNTNVCQVCDEDSPKVLPIWQYSIDKNKSEELLKQLAKNNKINYTIIRPGVTYGNTRIPYGITPPYGYHWTLVERILHGKPIITWNKGENYCNITHVDDFAVGVIGLLGNEKAFNDAFNIIGDDTPTWKEVLDTLSELLNKNVIAFDIPSKYYAKEIPSRKGEILGGRAVSGKNNNQKLKSIVPEFRQNISLKEGLKKTLDYYKSNNYIYGIDYVFDADTDRIIVKYARGNKISMKTFNLHYIDYLNEKKLKNMVEYLIVRNCNYFLVKIFIRAFRKINKILKSVILIIIANNIVKNNEQRASI